MDVGRKSGFWFGLAKFLIGWGLVSGIVVAIYAGIVSAGRYSNFNFLAFLVVEINLVGAAVFEGAICNYFGQMLKYRENEDNRAEAPSMESLPKL